MEWLARCEACRREGSRCGIESRGGRGGSWSFHISCCDNMIGRASGHDMSHEATMIMPLLRMSLFPVISHPLGIFLPFLSRIGRPSSLG